MLPPAFCSSVIETDVPFTQVEGRPLLFDAKTTIEALATLRHITPKQYGVNDTFEPALSANMGMNVP